MNYRKVHIEIKAAILIGFILVISLSSFLPGNTPTRGTLNATGPWLLIETTQGLWAANPDGSELQQLTDVDYWQGDIKQAIQPSGNHVVFLTPGNYDLHHMALNLLSLPDGKVTKITDLTSAATEKYNDGSPGDDGFEALRAVREQVNYAWSPDGSQLAFTGLMDGPSADIYLYNARSGAITRVSRDPAQDFGPSWSPDGNHLLYLAAEGFGTGAGGIMSGVWTADGKGGNPTLLFASDEAGEEVKGWLDNTIVMIATWAQPCGLQKLRLYDVGSKKATMLDSGCFMSATADGEYGAALYSNTSGVYLLTKLNRTPSQIDSEGDATIDRRYPGDQIFTVRFTSGGVATFGTVGQHDHQVSPVKVGSGEIGVAEYGAIWGWTSRNAKQPGAWITGPGMEIGQIYDGPAILPIWTRDNNLLFFASQKTGGYDLYLVSFDSYFKDLHRVNYLKVSPTCLAWLGTK